MNAHSRRLFLLASGASLIGITALPFSTQKEVSATPARADAKRPPSPEQALQHLLAGNLRFQRGQAIWPHQTVARRQQVAQGQSPHALIFGCVDSRVPPELVFDQGLGDLFTVRTAGHVLDQAALGSIEFGVAELALPLLVVLGHQGCGALRATMHAIDRQEHLPGSMQALVDSLRPSLLQAQGHEEQRLAAAVRHNILRTVKLLSRSKVLSQAVKAGQLALVGCSYDLETGAVRLLRHERSDR